jgi:hypothetical protein
MISHGLVGNMVKANITLNTAFWAYFLGVVIRLVIVDQLKASSTLDLVVDVVEMTPHFNPRMKLLTNLAWSVERTLFHVLWDIAGSDHSRAITLGDTKLA